MKSIPDGMPSACGNREGRSRRTVNGGANPIAAGRGDIGARDRLGHCHFLAHGTKGLVTDLAIKATRHAMSPHSDDSRRR